MTGQFLNAAFDVEKIDDRGVFTGYASVFDEVDNVKDKVAAGAFLKTLKDHQLKGRMPPLLWQHDTREPIGVFREMFEDKKGLYIRGQLFVDDIPRAKQAYRLLCENGLSGLSIGFKAVDSSFDPLTGVRTLLKIDLMEISLVTFPALDSARISHVKAALQDGRTPNIREFEAFLRDAGFSRKQAKTIVSNGYKTLLTPRDAGGFVQSDQDADVLYSLAERLRELAH